MGFRSTNRRPTMSPVPARRVARAFNRAPALVVFLSLAAALVGGCDYGPPVDSGGQTLREQITAVRSGTSDRIIVAAVLVTDSDIREISELPSVKHLELLRSHVDDEAMEILTERLPNLEVLVLGDTTITARGLTAVTKLKKLKRLNLGSTSLDDAALSLLPLMADLEHLRLGSRIAGDVAMPHVAKLTNLRTLHLRQMRITDAGLPPLVGMANLESLYFEDTKVTETGARFINGRRPALHVHFL